jgi:uncharacterized protein (TIGR02996 family)
MFKRTLQLGKVAYSGKRKINAVTLECRIEISERSTRHWDTLETVDKYLTISFVGAIWNGPKTDWVTGGQNVDEVARLVRTKRVGRIATLWREWHLNEMQGGTRTQREAINLHLSGMDEGERERFGRDHYQNSCEYLRSVGLNEDRGYRYGSAWLVAPLPVAVEIEIRELFTGDGTFRTTSEWVASLEREPFDGSLRAVYADWLQDQGQDQLAQDQRETARLMGLVVGV